MPTRKKIVSEAVEKAINNASKAIDSKDVPEKVEEGVKPVIDLNTPKAVVQAEEVPAIEVKPVRTLAKLFRFPSTYLDHPAVRADKKQAALNLSLKLAWKSYTDICNLSMAFSMASVMAAGFLMAMSQTFDPKSSKSDS